MTFQYDDYYKGWKAVTAVGAYNFKVVFLPALYKNTNAVEKILERIDNEYLAHKINTCREAFLKVRHELYDIGEDYTPSFTLDCVVFDDHDKSEFQFYMYIPEKSEGDNYGMWVAIFENNQIVNVKRLQL